MAPEFSCVQFPTEESKEDSASQQQPWLLFTDWKNRLIHNNNMFNNKQLQNCYYDFGGEIPEFLDRDILCSCREWVVLCGRYQSGLHVLVNLLSKETMELPPLEKYKYDYCILTSPPSDATTCHVVFFSFAKNMNSLIIWQPGDKEFTIKKWDYEIFPGEVVTLAVVAGKLFLDISRDQDFMGVLVMVEFKESTYRFEVVQMEVVQEDYTESEYRDSWQYYFFEYAGELFAVNKITRGIKSSNVAGFKIFKADLSNKKWVRIKNLGRLAIFICYKTAHCAAADSGIAANSVYFLEEDYRRSYYVYNLEEGTIRMKPMFYSIDTTKYMMLDWIMMVCNPSFPKVLKEHQESILQDSEGRSRTARKKKKKDEVKDSEKENGEGLVDAVQESWNMVPPKLLNLIQLRLFGRDHAVFRGVCKAWQQASIQWKQTSIQDYSIPSLLSSARLLEQCQNSSPLLMYQEGLTSSCDSVPIFRFFDPVHRKLYRTRIPELKEADIQYSSDGWLLVSRFSDQSIFFFNPLTQEKIELPRMPPDLSPPYMYTFKGSLSFSSSPTCSNCLVFGIDYYGETLCTLKHGDETWREHDLGYNGVRDWCNIVVLNGLHYFMSESRKYKDMAVFNVNAEGQVLDHQHWSQMLRRSKSLDEEDFLVEIDGVLAFVTIEANGGEISILKWNDMEKDWELMEGDVEFGGKQMFLSKRGSFMEKIDDVGAMGNIIFLPMIDDAKDGVFYSLATEKYHTFYSGYSSELPYNVDKFSTGIWIKPDRKIVGHNNLK